MAGMTIHDIASEAGVGKSTVSRVINGTGYVGLDTRKRIEAVMKRHHYTPSSAARSLSKKESDTIGLIIPEANNTFFAEILDGVGQMVDQNHLTLILCNTSNNIDKDFCSLQSMLRQRVKGLIFTPAAGYSTKKNFDKLTNLLQQLDCPTVLIDRPIADLAVDGVFSDNFAGAYKATEALIQAGHTRIGIIAGDLKLSIGCERYAGFEKALEAHGLKVKPKDVVQGHFDADTTFARMNERLDTGDLPTAFFISNNLSCNGFLKAVFSRGVRIPEDLAFIVFDKIDGQDTFGMKFSYVERDVKNMGRMAMQLLLNRFDDPGRPCEQVTLESRLQLLGSEMRVTTPPKA